MFKDIVRAGSDAFFALVSPSVSRNLGTGKPVWDATEKMSKMFPVEISTKGEMTRGMVDSMQQNAKKMGEQAKLWGEYAGVTGEYVAGYAKVVEAKAQVGVAMAEARTTIASAEKNLGLAVINAELEIRGAHREMAQGQAKLSLPEMLRSAIYDPAKQKQGRTDGNLVERYREKVAG